MNKVEEFIREFNNRSMLIFGGFTATPIIDDHTANVIVAVEVSKVYVDRALRQRISVIDIENAAMGHLELAQSIMRDMNDEIYHKGLE